MVRTVRLEFYPDLEHLIAENYLTYDPKRIVVYPSAASLRLFKTTRFGKRRNIFYKTTLIQEKNVDIIIIRKYTGIKSFRRGKKFSARTLPMVTLDRKLIHQGRIINRKEIVTLLDEFFKCLFK